MSKLNVMTAVREYLTLILVCSISLALITCNSQHSSPTSSDKAGPSVIAVSPEDNATQVPTNTTVTITFNEPVDPGSVVVLIDGVERGQISVSDSIVTVTLRSRLFQKFEYAGAVPAGVKDLAGNLMDSAYTWSFTTGFGPLGERWARQASPTANWLNCVVRGSYEFLVVGAGGTMLASDDGMAWTTLGFHPVADQLWSAYPIGDRYVVTGSPGTIIASNGDGLGSWTQDALVDSISNLYDIWVAFDGIYMVGTGGVSGTDGIVVKYISPTNWTSVNLGSNLTPKGVTQSGGNFVIVGDSGMVFTSTDGTTWDDHSLGKSWGSLEKVKWSDQAHRLIAVGSAIVSSANGISWTQHTSTSPMLFRDIGWTTLTVGGTTYSLYCAVGDAGKICTSEDAINWTPQNAGVTNDLYGIARGLVPTRFVVVGQGGVILTSE